MSSHLTFVTASAVTLALLCGPALSAIRQDVTLRYRWTKGETLRYRVTQKGTTTVSGIPGVGDMVIEQSTTQVLATSAEAVTPDASTLRQVVESMKMEMHSTMFAMSYDSANPDAGANPMNAMLTSVLSPMIGASYTVVMAPTGEVQKVEGLSALAEKMFQAIPQNPEMAGMLSGLKANLNDQAMRSQLGQTFARFPDRPIKSGDTWTSQVSSSNPMLGGLMTSVTLTLKAVEGDGSNRVARIATSLAIKPDSTKPPPANPMGLTMELGDATGDGEQVFEVGSGRLRGSTTRFTMPMTMSGAGPDGSPLTMKTSVTTTTTVELVQ
jgi:hypothetical protein